MSTYQLQHGPTDVQMPVYGLGVYRSPPGQQTYDAVKWALDSGYRLIDTAALYRNEASVGKAIEDSGIPREEIFVVTKLWDSSHGYEATLKAFDRSLQELRLQYVDLYLIHSPNTGKLVETWDALLQLQRQGRVRSIGVSNFNIQHIQAIQKEGRPLPAVNQFELHPLNYQTRRQLVDWCQSNGILVQAYGSIFSGQQQQLNAAVLQKQAAAHGKSAAQVLLRWAIQKGFQIIPKSVHQQRIQANSQLFDFELSVEQMAALDGMRGELHAYWNPLSAPVEIGDTSHKQEL